MIDVLYYMYYLFYSKKLKEADLHWNTVWFLGIFFSYWVFFAIDLFFLFFFLYLIPLEFGLTITASGVLLFYWIYSKRGRGKFVVEKKKPLIRGSFRLSVIWAILFFVITFVMIFSSGSMGKYMYQLVEPMSRMVFGE